MAEKKINRYALLDSFRGLTILWILCFHVLNGVRESYGAILNQIISHGYFGVSIFFVISGYSIASSIFNSNHSSFQPHLYLIRRLKRIYYCYWWHLLFVALIIPFLIAVVLMLKSHSFNIVFFQYSIAEWFQIATLTKVFSSNSWKLNEAFLPFNGVVWYIAIIVQIYLFVTICLYFRKIFNLLLFIGFIASILTCLTEIRGWIPFGLFLPSFYHFYIGIAIFYLIRTSSSPMRKKTQIAIFSVLLFLLLICIINENISVGFSFPFFTGFVIFILYDYDFSLNQLFLVRLFSLIGVFSYSLYLLHVPLSRIVGMFVWHLVPLSIELSWPLFLVPGIIILSFFRYLFFEKPLNQSDIINCLLSPIDTIKSGLGFIKQLLFNKNIPSQMEGHVVKNCTS